MITRLQSFPHKAEVDKNDWNKVKNNLVVVALAVAFFCIKRKLPLLFTSIIREGIPGVSTSRTHIEGRAFDISVKGWTDKDIFDIVFWINETFEIGAISAKSGKEFACVYEPAETWPDGSFKKAAHLHFQIAKSNGGFKG